MEEKQANTGAQQMLKKLNKELSTAIERGDKDEIWRLKMKRERIKVAAEPDRFRDEAEHQKYLDKKGRER